MENRLKSRDLLKLQKETERSEMKKISICIACYNEEKNIPLLYERVKNVINKIPQYNFEVIFSDNASKDSSINILRNIAYKDKRVKVIINNRNFGALRSGKNCLFHSKGDAIISLTCDLQDPPEMIPEFIKKWENGEKVVWGQKTKSEEKKIMYAIRSLYYKILKTFSVLPQYEHVTGFGLLDREVIEHAKKYSDNYIGIKAQVMELGYSVCLIPYTQEKRKAGKSSYNLMRYLDLGISRLVQASNSLLRVITLISCLFFTFTFLLCIILALCGYNIRLTSSLFIVFFLLLIVINAVEMLFICILGEYIGQILNKVTKAPLVIEKELINFEEN